MNTPPTGGPRLLEESPAQTAARAILLWISGQDDHDPEDRITALEALGALEDFLPANVVHAVTEERPGTLDEARQLLLTAVDAQTTPRALTGLHLAIGHLRHRLESR